ncbi:hypothetical protein [Flavobacterium sp. 3HN19-14]|uniref:hypothetical protein n=1 Tax=Flavobacterium sp. 3HN19-14 TaxID=3448133 RepID=UPI003EE18633
MIVLYIIGSLIALVLVTALFIRKDYSVKREILIEAPLLVVFDFIKYLRRPGQLWRLEQYGHQYEKNLHRN